MTRNEFISGLKQALSGELAGGRVQSHIDYYNEYIQSELQKGRSEAEVVGELGDPWAIAKTILQTEAASEHSYDDDSYVSAEKEETKRGSKVHVLGIDTWWKKLILILGGIGIIMLIVTVVGGIISLLVPIIVPVLVISFVIKFLKGFKRK